jgi:hypothetical protein
MSTATETETDWQANCLLLWNPEATRESVDTAGLVQKLMWLTDCQDLNSKPRSQADERELMVKVTSHIAATTDYGTLPSLLMEDDSKEKYTILCDIAERLNGDKEWEGSTHQGSKSRSDLALEPDPEPEPEPETVKDTVDDESVSDNLEDDPEVDNLLEALGKKLKGGRGGSITSSDKAEMKRFVKAEVDTLVKKETTALRAQIKEAIDTLPPRDIMVVQHKDMSVEIDGLVHKQYKEILGIMTCRPNGFPLWPYIYGGAGAGKTTLFRQLFDGLGIPRDKQKIISMEETLTTGKMVGYKNLVNGEMVEGFMRHEWEHGGGIAFDEVDNFARVLVALNGMDGDGYLFPDGWVKRHPDFYLIASANTLGTGSMNGFNRGKIDAAVLDRYQRVKLEYDTDLERKISVPDGLDAKTKKVCNAWVDYVIKVREYVEKNSQQTIHITPRASKAGAAMLAHGLDIDTVLKATIFTYMDEAMIKKITSEHGYPKGLK